MDLKKTKIGTTIALTISVLVTFATLGVALYALYFVQNMAMSSQIQSELYNQLNLLKESLQLIVIAFLVFGLISAYFVTKLVMQPLNEIVNGTKELSKGNFKFRFKSSKYEEFSKLIETYNKMAENLESLYSELENKVKERTKELENANSELKSAQAMMVHSEKMRSLGQLVAGITHEINNPINFVHGNMPHLKNYTTALFQIIELYESFEQDLNEEKQTQLKELKDKIELSFIKEDLPKLIKSCHEGTERTKSIILDLKNFSRLDEMVINEIDLPKEIDTTLNILHNKIKNQIEVIKEYEDDIPPIEGYGGQLNQVFMNIIDNACYAMNNSGKLYIRLKKVEKNVIIEFEDTGCGIAKEQLEKIFDPFYTTKQVGEGTGLGMSISYKVIENHDGKILVESTVGKGTKFTIVLPILMKKS